MLRILRTTSKTKTPLHPLPEMFETQLSKQLPDKSDQKKEMRTLVMTSMELFRGSSGLPFPISSFILFYVLSSGEVSHWFADGMESSDVAASMLDETERLLGLPGQVAKVTGTTDTTVSKLSQSPQKYEKQR